MVLVSFVVPDYVDFDGVEGWSPDEEPTRFPTGQGHAVLELAACLRSSQPGFQVHVGSRAARDADVVVLLLSTLARRTEGRFRTILGTYTSLMQRRLSNHGALVVIRGDEAVAIRSLVRPQIEIVNDPGCVLSTDQRFVPLLPQRGLRPRDPARSGRIRDVAVKAMSGNLPAALRTETLDAELAAVGIRLHRHLAPTDWPTFTAVDAVLCVHPSTSLAQPCRKPPTKLVNAWSAGAIPIVVEDLYCTSLDTSGHDSVRVPTLGALVPTLSALNDEPATVARIESGVRQRQREYSRGLVLLQWAALIEEAANIRVRRRWSEVPAALLRELYRLGLGRKLRSRLGRVAVP
jgi:hypothetical protein